MWGREGHARWTTAVSAPDPGEVLRTRSDPCGVKQATERQPFDEAEVGFWSLPWGPCDS